LDSAPTCDETVPAWSRQGLVSEDDGNVYGLPRIIVASVIEGEVCGLEWSAVDFDSGYLNVQDNRVAAPAVPWTVT
jgi:hypothetical protein